MPSVSKHFERFLLDIVQAGLGQERYLLVYSWKHKRRSTLREQVNDILLQIWTTCKPKVAGVRGKKTVIVDQIQIQGSIEFYQYFTHKAAIFYVDPQPSLE